MSFFAQIPSPAQWQTFYEIVGSSGGSLVGLQFVVIVLITNTRNRADFQAIHAFGTPNVVHFSAALAIAAIMSAPWPSMMTMSLAMGICGVIGLGYSANVFRRARHQTVYHPVIEDWIFYAIVPCSIYAAVTAAAFLLPTSHHVGFFMIAAAALSLLLIGIRNSWDSVTHVASGGDVNGPDKKSGVAKKPADDVANG